MAIYTAPNNSYIDRFMEAARYRDSRTGQSKRDWIEGMGKMVGAGVDATKWQMRKNALDEQETLKRKLEALKAERDELVKRRNQRKFPVETREPRTRNFDLFLAGLDENLMKKEPEQKISDIGFDLNF